MLFFSFFLKKASHRDTNEYRGRRVGGSEVPHRVPAVPFFLPQNVTERVQSLVDALSIPVGFHAHNNLGMAIANSVAAVDAGALMLDGCARGFGAGAGNAQLEVLVAVLERLAYQTNIDLYKILDAAELAEKVLIPEIPTIKNTSIISGLAGVFSGFMKPVARIADEFGVDPKDIFFELGKRKIIAGQEDIIIEVARYLSTFNKEVVQ
jgi:4-hydroxy 2-oxovalerate aldolase